jgi:hypothetical protein
MASREVVEEVVDGDTDTPGVPGVPFPSKVCNAAKKASEEAKKKIPIKFPEYDRMQYTGEKISMASTLMPWHVIQVIAFWMTFLADLPISVVEGVISGVISGAIDLNGNLGLDAIVLALVLAYMFGIKKFPVHSVEISDGRHECSKHNISVSGLKDAVFPIKENCIEYIDQLVKTGKTYGFFYIDPPWTTDGNYDPRNKYTDMFVISEIKPDGTKTYLSIFVVIEYIFENNLTDTIVLKIPPNSAFAQLSKCVKESRVGIFGPEKNRRYPQYFLVILKKVSWRGSA